MSRFELTDLVRYFHNVRNDKGQLVPIIGEDKLAVTAALAYLLEDTNFLINAYSGTGKTVIMNAVFGLLDGTGIQYEVIEQMSETAMWYDTDRINECRFVAIPEAQKAPESIIEILKTWADDRPAERRRTDVTINDIRVQQLYPKFVFMCKAVENKRGEAYLDAELERRYMITHTNPTVKQTKEVLRYKLKQASQPVEDLEDMSEEEIQALREHFRDCIIRRDDARAIKIRNPCAPFLFDLIPNIFPIARSKVHYLLKLIKGVARFFPDEIISVQKNEHTYGLVTPKHNWLAIQIYIDSFVTECLQMPAHGTDVLHLIPDSEIDQFGLVTTETIKMSRREIQQAARSAGLPFAQKNINPLLSSLVMLGFLEMEEEGNKKLFFKSALVKEPSTKIDWNEVVEQTKKLVTDTWPADTANEYIARHCTEIEVEDPFTRKKSILGATAPMPKKEVGGDDYGSWLE